MSGCPDNRCDGSGFLYEGKRALPCSCRPARMARKRAAAVAGRLPRKFREVSFEREPVVSIERSNPAVVREVRLYVAAVRERLAEGRGIWFAGQVGTGKTTLAMLVSKAAMEADRTVAIYSLPRLLGLLRDSYGDDARYTLNELITRLSEVDLLHVDDVGAEQTSAWVLEQLYAIVNTRYEDGRAIVLTTNLDHDALEAQIGGRTVSRLYEMCGQPLPMFGEDQRRGREFRLPAAARVIGGDDRELGAAGDDRGFRADRGDRGLGGDRDDDAYWEAATPPRYGRRPLD